MSRVIVHAFKVGGDKKFLHPRKAIETKVARLVGAEIIKGSAEDVDEAEISHDGFWYPDQEFNSRKSSAHR